MVRSGHIASRVDLSGDDFALALLKPVALPRLSLGDGFDASVAACHPSELAKPPVLQASAQCKITFAH